MISLQQVTNTFSRYEENLFVWYKNTIMIIIIIQVEAVYSNESQYCQIKRKYVSVTFVWFICYWNKKLVLNIMMN